MPSARVVLVTAMLALASVAIAGDGSGARRKELRQLEKQFHFKELLVRRDIVASGPPPGGGRFTELRDGSYYQHSDASIAFEKLSPVRVQQTALRAGGRMVLVTLGPPTDLRPYIAGGAPPELASYVLAEVDIPEDSTVRDALRTLLYLPGETPSEDEVKECLARYPDMPEGRSRLRCGLPAP
jgi:hypothetical protein